MLDEDGLWIIWRTPDPDWEGVPSDESRPATEPRQLESDSWLDLIDPATGRTLARHYDKGVFQSFVHGSRSRYFYSYHIMRRMRASLHLPARAASVPGACGGR